MKIFLRRKHHEMSVARGMLYPARSTHNFCCSSFACKQYHLSVTPPHRHHSSGHRSLSGSSNPWCSASAGCSISSSSVAVVHSSSSSSSGGRTPLAAAVSRSCRCMSSAYDNPALYSNDDAFSERLYWDKRYQQDPTTFEWYRSYDSLKPILTQHLPKQQRVMQLGVGTSRIQEDMADDGYIHITSIDYSPVAIQRLQQAYLPRPQLEYAVADARSMPQYADGSFGGVLDKGTLDALLCGDDDAKAAAELLGEVWRLLASGGAYVMITSASPKSRLQYLQTPATPWQQLTVYEVGQQGAMNGPYLCSNSNSNSSSDDGSRAAGSDVGSNSSSGAAGDQLLQLEEALKLPQMGYSHMVYVCYKP